MTVRVILSTFTPPPLPPGTGTVAQAVGLRTSTGATSTGSLAISGSVAPIADATLNATLSTAAAITSLPATVGASTIPSGTVLLLVWGGYFQAFVTRLSSSPGATSVPVNSITPNFAYPSGTVLAVSTNLPYLQFPVTPPPAVTSNPGVRFIVHNWAFGTPVQPWLLNSDGTLFNANGGYLCRLEPGQMNVLGSTSLGTINQTVPGTPSASMRVAFQNLLTTESGGFNIATLAWMV